MDHRPEPPRSTPGVGHRRRRPIRPLQHPRSTPDHVGRAAESIGGSAAPAGRLLLPPSGGHPAERLGPRGDRHPDEVIAGLAGRQQGVVSRRQLLAAGVSPEMIRHRRGRGRLHDLRPPIRGVYLVGHAVEAPLACERAALLACAPQSVVLSHRSAAVAWGIADPMPGPVDVTVIGPRAPRRPGLRGHRAATIDAGSWRWHRGLALTTPARTVIDLAASASLDELEAIVDRAKVARLLRDGELRQAVDVEAPRAGVAAVRALLDAEQPPGFSRSAAERVALRVIGAAGLPAPSARNDRAGRFELDLVWHRERVVLEVDGRAYHRTSRSFERDRAKDGALHAAGYRVLRVTWRRLTHRPEAMVAQLAAILALAQRDAAVDERLRRAASHPTDRLGDAAGPAGAGEVG